MSSINIPSTVDDPNYRYKMPRVRAKIEGRGNGIKTNIMNMSDIARALKRPPEYPTKFCGCELGSSSKFEGAEGKAIVNGAHTEPDIQIIIDKFIERFVLCPQCRLPEVDLRVHKGRVQGLCNACGFNGDMDNTHKVGTFIVRNPPDGATSTMGSGGSSKKTASKKERRAEKHSQKDQDENNADEEKSKKEKSKKEKSKDKKSKSKSKSSSRHHADDELPIAALTFDSPEIQSVIDRIDDFLHRAEKPTTKDFFEEVRLLQVAQDFSPVMRVYVSLCGLHKRTDELTEISIRNEIRYLTAVCDRSIEGEMILEAFEQFLANFHPEGFKSYAKICNELYTGDLVDEEAFLNRYSTVRSENNDGDIRLRAQEAASAFIHWLSEAESASD